MGFVKIFQKNNIQEVYCYLPKTNIGQISSEILAQLCSDLIQILLF